jgi:hypothetical protein
MMIVLTLTDAERIVMPSKRRFTKSLFDVMVVSQSVTYTLRGTIHGKLLPKTTKLSQKENSCYIDIQP